MANLLEVLGVSPDDMGSVPQDIKDASSLLEGMQDIYEEMPLSKRKEEFANVISEGVKQLLIRLGALTRLGVQSTQNIQQQLPEPKDYRGSLYVRTSIMDDYKEPYYTIYAVNSDFTFPNGERTISSVYYKRNDNVEYFATDTIEEFEDIFATNEMTLLPFKIGDVLKLEKSVKNNAIPSGYSYISINGYSEKGLNITFWAEVDGSLIILEDKTDFSIFKNWGDYFKDMNIVQYLTKFTNSGNYVKVDNVQVPTNQTIIPTKKTPPRFIRTVFYRVSKDRSDLPQAGFGEGSIPGRLRLPITGTEEDGPASSSDESGRLGGVPLMRFAISSPDSVSYSSRPRATASQSARLSVMMRRASTLPCSISLRTSSSILREVSSEMCEDCISCWPRNTSPWSEP